MKNLLLPAAFFTLIPFSSYSQCPVDSIPQMNYLYFGDSCYIDEVTVDAVTYSTASGHSAGFPSYQAFTNPVIQLTQGMTHSVSISGICTGNYGVAIWADLDQSGTFDGISECLANVAGTGATVSFSFNIPYTAISDTVALRIIKFRDAISWGFDCWSMCGMQITSATAETEDYLAFINCSGLQSLSFDPNPMPCFQSQLELFAESYYGYVLWYNDTTSAPLDTNFYFTYYPVGLDTVFYVQEIIGGCASSFYPMTINLQPAPAVNINSPDTVYSCTTVSFDAGAGYQYYNWSDGTNLQTTTITNGYGGYLTVYVQDFNGCTGSDQVWTAIAPLSPGAYAHVNMGNFCQNGNIELIYDSLINPGTCDWYELPSNTLIGSGAMISYTPTDTGMLSFRACISSMCGVDTVVVSNYVAPLPDVDTITVENGTMGPGGIISVCTGSTWFQMVASTTSGEVIEWIVGDTLDWMDFAIPDDDTLEGVSGMLVPEHVYYVYVMAMNTNGCTSVSDTIYLTPTQSFFLNFPDTLNLCSMPQNIGVTIDYGIYDALWNTGDTTGSIIISVPGDYSLTVSNQVNGCVSSDQFYISSTPPDFNVFPDTTYICIQGALFFVPDPDYSAFSWTETDSQFNVIGTGTDPDYPLSGTPNVYIIAQLNHAYGCQGVDTTFLSYSSPVISLGPDTVVSAMSYTITGPAGYSYYNWQPTNEYTQSITVTATGSHTLTVYNDYLCTATDTILVTFLTTGLDDAGTPVISIAPNPSSGFFNITASSAMEIVRVYDLQGNLVQSVSAGGKMMLSINTTEMAEGIYIVEADTGNGISRSKVVIRE
ncbi:MAG TPA: T9SS type A sorting domain-containing protein [Bacteroidia bacterium]|nr:T9SS type A sorting domain-containing protein [Bacteroidia bacterium]